MNGEIGLVILLDASPALPLCVSLVHCYEISGKQRRLRAASGLPDLQSDVPGVNNALGHGLIFNLYLQVVQLVSKSLHILLSHLPHLFIAVC
jgi:hypothetical protein